MILNNTFLLIQEDDLRMERMHGRASSLVNLLKNVSRVALDKG